MLELPALSLYLSHLGAQELSLNLDSLGSQGTSSEVGPEIPKGSHAQSAQQRFSFSLPLLELLGKFPPAMPLAAAQLQQELRAELTVPRNGDVLWELPACINVCKSSLSDLQ